MFRELINNISLLIALGLLYDVLPLQREPSKRRLQGAITGVVLGFFGVALMLNPWTLSEGLIFDTRSVLLSVSGLYFGTLPTLIAMLITGGFRAWQGGAGMWMGISVILTSGLTGILWRRWRRRELMSIGAIELYVMGVIVHILMLGCTFFLPREVQREVLASISPAVLVIYPVGTMLLGILLGQRLRRKHSDQALQESEERWQFALESAGDGVWEWNPVTNETYFSPRWKAMLGYADHEIEHRHEAWLARIQPDDKDEVLEKLNRHFRGETPYYAAEYRLKCRNGDYKWVLGRGKVISWNSTGQPQRLVGTLTDIHDQKNAEEERRIFLEMLQLMNLGIEPKALVDTIIRYNQEHRVADAVCIRYRQGSDDLTLQSSGFPEYFVKSGSCDSISVELGDEPGSEQGTAENQCLCRLVLSGKADLNTPNFTPYGSFWSNAFSALPQFPGCMNQAGKPPGSCALEGYESVVVLPLRSGKEIVGMIQVANRERGRFSPSQVASFERLSNNVANYLAKTQVEKELQESEERFRLAFENASSGMCMINLEGRFMRVNNKMCQVFGYSRAEFETLTVGALTHPHDQGLGLAAPEKMLEEQKEEEVVEKRYIHRDGRMVWGQAATSLVRDALGQPCYFIAVIQDVTARRQAEEQIRLALREKEILLRELYHRTKNNMQLIRSILMLQTAGTDSPEVLRLVREIDHKIQSISLVHQMLYHSPDLSHINLQTYLQELVELIFSSYSQPSGKVALCLDLEPVHVTIDIATPLGLILNELLSNACKHAFPGEQAGEISISIHRKDDSQICLQFADNGVGVPPSFDLRRQKTFGLISMFTLAENQLNGQVRVDTSRGLAFTIVFSDNHYASRIPAGYSA